MPAGPGRAAGRRPAWMVAAAIVAYQASRSAVDGYWLNIPGNGPRCPTCNTARPDIGVKALNRVL